MLNKNVIKKLILCFALFLIIINVVYSADSYEFGDWSWRQFYNDDVFLPWWGNDAAISFNEPGELNWYHIEDWEKQWCTNSKTSDFYYDQNVYNKITIDDRVYDITIALNAELQDTIYFDENGNQEYSLTVGWYIQGMSEGSPEDKKVKYKILLKPGNDYLDLGDGETEKEFTIITGTFGFYNNYTTSNYNEVNLIIDSKTYEFDITRLNEEGVKI